MQPFKMDSDYCAMTQGIFDKWERKKLISYTMEFF